MTLLHFDVFFLQYSKIYFFQTSLMQKIFLRGVVVLVILFVAAFFYSTYRYYRVIHSDDPVIPIVLVESGSLTLVHE